MFNIKKEDLYCRFINAVSKISFRKVAFITFLSTATLGITIMKYTWQSSTFSMNEKAIRLANVIASSLDDTMIKAIGTGRIDSSIEKQLSERLILLTEGQEGIKSIFLQTAEGGNIYPVKEERNLNLDMLKRGNTIVNSESNKEDSLVSILVPIKNPEDGEVVAIFGLDYPAETFYTEAKARVYELVIITLLSFALGILILKLLKINADNLVYLKKLKNNTDILNKVQEVANMGYWVFDVKRKKITLSDNAFKIFGLNKDEFVDGITLEFLSQLIHDDDKLRVSTIMNIPIYKKPFEEEIKYRAVRYDDGRVRNMNAKCVYVRNTINKITKVIGFVQDVTDCNRAELCHLEKNSKLAHYQTLSMVGQMTVGLTHDFKNQLLGITGFCSLLSNRLKDEESIKMIQHIETCAKNCNSLTERLMNLSHFSKPEYSKIDVHAVIKDVFDIVKLRSASKKVRIYTNLEAENSLILANLNRIQNVFLNLGINAIDAIKTEGEITISTKVVSWDSDELIANAGSLIKSDYIEVTISDTGTGMSESTVKHIFEPFFTTKGDHGGTGMGLSNANTDVIRHHGIIMCASELMKGTTFKVYLPVLELTFVNLQ